MKKVRCVFRVVVVCLSALAVACVPGGSSSDSEAPRFHRITDGAIVTDAASTGGVTWVDYNSDGRLDLFVTNGYDVSSPDPEPQKNRLYRNDGGGVLAPVTAGPLVEDDGFSSGSTWGDYDNDGDLDVFVTNQREQNNFLYRNEGGGHFIRIEDGPLVSDGGHSYSAAWVDVDNDRHLDLFVSNGGLGHVEQNFLYRNDGEGGFERVVDGDIASDVAPSCGAVWGDYDGDGDQDLFVTNQSFDPVYINNALYRNEGSWVFTRMTDHILSTDAELCAAAAWGDYDNDADLDLYVANQYGAANLLYRNDGGDSFARVTGDPAVVDGGHTLGANWADHDNDGDLDLLVVNWGAAPVLYTNQGSAGFRRTGGGDLGQVIGHAASVAWGDYDHDGDQDAYIGSWPNSPGPDERNLLYRNDGVAGHWLEVRLVGTVSNAAGIGARITVITDTAAGPQTQIREVAAGTSWRSQNSLVQHFGLGEASMARSVTVRWPSGNVDELGAMAANQWLVITEGAER